jgi:predicted enzyme related to lactoylglutathione lyase
MIVKRFFQIVLRTSDVEAARAFYVAVLGGGAFDIVQLHEQAVARGARPHWLGFVHVGDVEHALAAFVQRGATQLSPIWVNPEGLEAATARDPGGAVIALAKQPDRARGKTASAGGSGAQVIWYELNTVDVERAKANYRELFGWEFKEPLDLEGVGVVHPFAWEEGGAAVGSMCDVAGRRGVHPHWLFHLRVDALEPATNAVREKGGVVAASVTLPGRDRIAICDDPQGAAFAIRETAKEAR